MQSGKAVFKQLLQFLPRYEFNLCVDRYRGERRVKKFSTYDQFLCLAYAQMAGRESLRDQSKPAGTLIGRNFITSVSAATSPERLLPMLTSAGIGAFFRTSAVEYHLRRCYL